MVRYIILAEVCCVVMCRGRSRCAPEDSKIGEGLGGRRGGGVKHSLQAEPGDNPTRNMCWRFGASGIVVELARPAESMWFVQDRVKSAAIISGLSACPRESTSDYFDSDCGLTRATMDSIIAQRGTPGFHSFQWSGGNGPGGYRRLPCMGSPVTQQISNLSCG